MTPEKELIKRLTSFDGINPLNTMYAMVSLPTVQPIVNIAGQEYSRQHLAIGLGNLITLLASGKYVGEKGDAVSDKMYQSAFKLGVRVYSGCPIWETAAACKDLATLAAYIEQTRLYPQGLFRALYLRSTQ